MVVFQKNNLPTGRQVRRGWCTELVEVSPPTTRTKGYLIIFSARSLDPKSNTKRGFPPLRVIGKNSFPNLSNSGNSVVIPF
jgi:hypothetical protein